MAYLALIVSIAVMVIFLLYLLLVDPTTPTTVAAQDKTSVLQKMDEILDDRTAVGTARARVMPSDGTVGDFTDFDPHLFEREKHIYGAEIDFADSTPTEADKDATDRLKKELGSAYGTVAGKLFKLA